MPNFDLPKLVEGQKRLVQSKPGANPMVFCFIEESRGENTASMKQLNNHQMHGILPPCKRGGICIECMIYHLSLKLKHMVIDA